MPSDPVPIPQQAVLHRDAAARGLTPSKLRHPRWAHPARGLAVPVAALGDLQRLCIGVQLVLPADAAFSHLTAAALHGWWLPSLSSAPPLIATAGRGSPHRDRRGVFVRRCCLSPHQRTSIDGIRVTSPEWTLVELAEHLSLVDLVIVLDSALATGQVSPASVSAALVPHRPGVVRLRRALSLADRRSESAWESALRLVHVMAGFQVEPQHEVYDVDGAFVARLDLWLVGSRRGSEFDGAHHRDRHQHQEDLRREKALARCGWERYGYTATEICHRVHMIIRDAEAALGLPHNPTRLAAWQRAYRESSLSAPGRAALDRRLNRFVRARSPRPSGG
jgi:very-short-patch-repair endonuclease